MHKLFLLTCFMAILSFSGFTQTLDRKIRADSILIVKNWRTKDKVILAELGFKPGEEVGVARIEQSINKIWNIGNFSDVSYKSVLQDDGKNLLIITAKDAVTIMPLLSFNGNKNDFKLSAGVLDNNFLGRNIGIDIAGSTGTNVKDLRLGLSIPRQLLYKNMTLNAGITYGHGIVNRYNQRELISSAGFLKKEFYGSIGNPYHTDYAYTFSPNFSWSLFQHKSDSSITESPLEHELYYKVNYLALSLSESLGIINRKRHQEDGYMLSAGTSFGIDLDKSSPYFQSFSFSASYQKLFNPVIQFSSNFSTGYTTSDIPSIIFNKGSGDVKGILQGEIAGKSFYTASVGGHLTYINRKWIALEHTLFLNWGQGANKYKEIYSSKPLATLGTGVQIMMPLIPWLSVRFYCIYSGRNSNWFNMEF